MGRVVIPSDMRTELGLHYGTSVKISTEGAVVRIEAFVLECYECRSRDVVLEWFPNVYLCHAHARAWLGEKYERLKEHANADG
jgi:bifunctional DNA-binding transcriptional regulator/antitoxin component of YhaV-PrlF toxin-antitoxin module